MFIDKTGQQEARFESSPLSICSFFPSISEGLHLLQWGYFFLFPHSNIPPLAPPRLVVLWLFHSFTALPIHIFHSFLYPTDHAASFSLSIFYSLPWPRASHAGHRVGEVNIELEDIEFGTWLCISGICILALLLILVDLMDSSFNLILCILWYGIPFMLHCLLWCDSSESL